MESGYSLPAFFIHRPAYSDPRAQNEGNITSLTVRDKGFDQIWVQMPQSLTPLPAMSVSWYKCQQMLPVFHSIPYYLYNS